MQKGVPQFLGGTPFFALYKPVTKVKSQLKGHDVKLFLPALCVCIRLYLVEVNVVEDILDIFIIFQQVDELLKAC